MPSPQQIYPAPMQDPGHGVGHRRRDLHRLAASWRITASRYVSAEAHSRPDERSLGHTLFAIEDAIAERHPDAWSALEGVFLEALLTWAHDGDSAEACLICRRIRNGLPLTAPMLPKSWAVPR
jgi:hypothetical protein